MGLLLGTTPIFIGIISTVSGLEVLGRRFWTGAVLSFIGVGFVALGSSNLSGHAVGLLLAVCIPLTWGAYSVAIVPLMRRYSPFRISALVLAAGWVPLAIVGAPQTLSQGFHFGWLTWARVRLRRRRPVVPDEHPLVHRDRPGRPVARVAVREPAAVLRRAVCARPARGASEPMGDRRWTCDRGWHRARPDAADATRAARRLT